MSKLGTADLGIATLNDMVQNASMIASLDPSVRKSTHRPCNRALTHSPTGARDSRC